MAEPSVEGGIESGWLVALKQTSKVSPCPGLHASRKLSKYLKAGTTGGLSSCCGSVDLGSLKSQASLSSCPKNWSTCCPSCGRLGGTGHIGNVRLRSVKYWWHSSPVPQHTLHTLDDDMARQSCSHRITGGGGSGGTVARRLAAVPAKWLCGFDIAFLSRGGTWGREREANERGGRDILIKRMVLNAFPT